MYLKLQLEDFDDKTQIKLIEKHVHNHHQHIEVLKEGIISNQEKGLQLKEDLLSNYRRIKKLNKQIKHRIQHKDIQDYLELIIKNNFLESQNVQLLLNLQLRSRTIRDLQNMIVKQQKLIQEHNMNGQIEIDCEDEEEEVEQDESDPADLPEANSKKSRR